MNLQMMFLLFTIATTTCWKLMMSPCWLFLQLIKEFQGYNLFNIHENLIEALLELQLYADVQALLVKYDGKSSTSDPNVL